MIATPALALYPLNPAEHRSYKERALPLNPPLARIRMDLQDQGYTLTVGSLVHALIRAFRLLAHCRCLTPLRLHFHQPIPWQREGER